MNTLAIINGNKYKYKTKDFPRWPISGDRELELLTEVINSGNWWRMNGSKVSELERKFAALHNVKYCLGVTNGTQAIELVLAALDIQSGDEVIVPAFTFISTFTAPIYANATPIPVDVDSETFCMTPEAFEKAITPKTKAVIPVHMAGQMCDMDRICEIAKRNNIRVIEDAAHAHGASWKDKKAGYYCDAAIFSFQNGKIMTCGEGGAIITNNKELYDKLYLLHGVGRPEDDKVYQHLVLGTNARMNEFQGAVLLAQLERLDFLNHKREENSKYLDELLCEVEGITPQKCNSSVTLNTHYMYMFYYDRDKFGGKTREEFVNSLCAEGIPAFVAYPVVSNTEFYKKCDFRGRIDSKMGKISYELPNAEKIADEVVWLPHYTLLGDEKDIEEIVGAINKIKDNFNKD